MGGTPALPDSPSRGMINFTVPHFADYLRRREVADRRQAA
jgi:hypothetical protein